METIGERIRQIRKARNISGTELERRTGIKREYISKLENNVLKNITYSTMLKISKGLGVPASNLIIEEPTPEFSGAKAVLLNNSGNNKNRVNHIKATPISLITSENYRCFSGSDPSKIENSETILISYSWLKTPDDPQRYRCIKLSRYCRIMSPVIEPESTICIDLKQNNIEVLEGGIIAVLYENELSLGYLQKEKNYYILLPENSKEYHPKTISSHDGNIVLGKVIWAFMASD